MTKRRPAIHVLKCRQPFFDHVHDGIKTFELRYNDRDYRVGDMLLLVDTVAPLRGWDDVYKHRWALVDVTYFLRSSDVNWSKSPILADKWAVMGVKVAAKGGAGLSTILSLLESRGMSVLPRWDSGDGDGIPLAGGSTAAFVSFTGNPIVGSEQ